MAVYQQSPFSRHGEINGKKKFDFLVFQTKPPFERPARTVKFVSKARFF